MTVKTPRKHEAFVWVFFRDFVALPYVRRLLFWKLCEPAVIVVI